MVVIIFFLMFRDTIEKIEKRPLQSTVCNILGFRSIKVLHFLKVLTKKITVKKHILKPIHYSLYSKSKMYQSSIQLLLLITFHELIKSFYKY